MKVVYVAGPYRAKSEYEVVQNIRRAEHLAIEVWKTGAACICPHKNTALFGGACPDHVWLEGDLEIITRCDALILVEGWESSVGAKEEVLLAKHRGMPVFCTVSELNEWLNG